MIFMHEKRALLPYNHVLAISHFTSRFMLLSNLEFFFFKSSEMTKRSKKPKTFQSQKKKV